MLPPCNPMPLKPNSTPSIPQNQILPPCNPLPLKPNSTASIPQNQIPPLEVFDFPSHDFPSLPSNPNPNQAPPPPPPTTNPWSNPPALHPRSPRKFNLRFIPPVPRGDLVVGVCSPEAVAAELKVLDNTLVGFVMGKKPSFSLVKQSLLKQWKISGSVDILQLIQGGFGFRFSKVEDRDYIYEIGVFYVGGLPIFLRPWERSIHSGGVLGLRRVPLWITLPGLPLHLWGEDSLSAICSVLGTPLFTNGTTAMKSRWVFARVCVEFSGDAPLLDSVLVEDDMGTQFKQIIKYEWKPLQCLSCGVFGHEEGSCLVGVSGDTPGVHRTAQENPVSSHTVEENAAGNSPNAAEINQEDPGGQTLQRDPPRVEDIRLKDKASFSFLLQKRSWKNMNGKVPHRVRKMSPMERDPTRSHENIDPHHFQPDLCPETGHMSCREELPDGPATISSDCSDQINSIPLFRKDFSKTPFPLLPMPSLTNRFRLLATDKDLSPSVSPDMPDVACSPHLAHCNVPHTPSYPPDLSPKPKKPPVDQKLSQQNSKLSAPAQMLDPILVGGSLDSSEIQSEPLIPSASPDGPSSPLVSSLDKMTSLVHTDPTPTLARDNLSRYLNPGSSFPEPNPLIQPCPSGSSPYSPTNRVMTGPCPSSAGHTPFPTSSTLNLSSFSCYQDSVNPPFAGPKTRSFTLPISRPNQLAVRTNNGNNLHSLMAPICKKNLEERPDAPAEEGEEEDEEKEDGLGKVDHEDVAEEEDSHYRTKESTGDDPDQMLKPIPHFNAADDSAEYIEEEVDEEAVGTEEDVDEDSEEEKETQIERVDAVEETDSRKKWSNYGRYRALWVTTTLDDPRRINF